MKAIDIVNKFEDIKIKEQKKIMETVHQTFKDLLDEILEIAKVRKAVTDRAFVSIIKEQNLKLESANDKLKYKYGNGLFVKNAFILFMCNEMPSLKEYFEDYL